VAYTLEDKLVVGITSRALFDLDEAHEVFEAEGLESYRAHQVARESVPLSPGAAFGLVKGLLRLNGLTDQRLVEVLVISRNDADSGLRMMNSAEHHGLDIPRWAFTDGRDASRYLPAFRCHVFLSANADDVHNAIKSGYAAARVLRVPDEPVQEAVDEVRIAFDGDAVLFGGSSEALYQDEGLERFLEYEVQHADEPLEPGPMKPFLEALARLQSMFEPGENPIRTALVTARNAPAHRRVLATLRAWDVRLNESFFLGGLPKADVLNILRPHIFFDDQLLHLEPARRSVAAAEVPAVYVGDESDGPAEKPA
jgi:5'-nucleotidase